MNVDILWSKFLTEVKDNLTSLSFDTWFKDTQLYKLDNGKAYIIVPMPIHKKHLADNYSELILNHLNNITGTNFELVFLLKEEIEEEEEKSNNITEENLPQNIVETSGVPHNQAQSNLKSKYTFDNFIVGNSNKFAHAAALSVAENPGNMYNPLFIYGNSGLGKTHLMHAIGNYITENSNRRVLYVTSDQFIQDFIGINKKDEKGTNFNYVDFFKNKYRNIDVLLIDDIQFIAGKKMGQEEFFHTFNTLHQNGKQIIISSDKPPRDIPLLEERLKSRFEWGILADISMPDYETRLAILRKKVQTDKIIIDDYILSVIATKIDSNIRELEGALNKIVAYASLTHSPITIEIAEKSINDIVLQKEKVISADYIQEVVAKYFNIDKKDLISSKKSNDIAHPRQIAMYLCRAVAQMSFPKIGAEFGNRDHTTVMHAVNKIEKEIKEKTNTKLIVESVKNIIQDSN